LIIGFSGENFAELERLFDFERAVARRLRFRR